MLLLEISNESDTVWFYISILGRLHVVHFVSLLPGAFVR
jgi:hypothetical protein